MLRTAHSVVSSSVFAELDVTRARHIIDFLPTEHAAAILAPLTPSQQLVSLSVLAPERRVIIEQALAC